MVLIKLQIKLRIEMCNFFRRNIEYGNSIYEKLQVAFSIILALHYHTYIC